MKSWLGLLLLCGLAIPVSAQVVVKKPTQFPSSPPGAPLTQPLRQQKFILPYYPLYGYNPWLWAPSPWLYPSLYRNPVPQIAPPVVGPVPNLGGVNKADAILVKTTQVATLTMQVPSRGTWTANGVSLDGEAATRTLASPELARHEEHTFEVLVQWQKDGTQYEVKKSKTVKAGDNAKITIYAGTVVKAK